MRKNERRSSCTMFMQLPRRVDLNRSTRDGHENSRLSARPENGAFVFVIKAPMIPSIFFNVFPYPNHECCSLVYHLECIFLTCFRHCHYPIELKVVLL